MTFQRTDIPTRVVQITDSHLFRDPGAALLRLNTQDSFERVVELVARRETRIDVILATGDIAQDASLEAYVRFVAAMELLPAPFYWIPGNHDRRRIMQKVSADREASVNLLRFGNWQIIMLDSTIVGETHGRLDAAEIAHLEACLQMAESDDAIDHTLVCLHHNPIPGNAQWMDGIGLHDPHEFLAVIERYPSVRGVVYGHIHQEMDLLRNGVRYFCTPSTCIQFKAGAEHFTLDDLSPAYRWFDLHGDGRIGSAVERVTGYEFELDHDSTGY